MSFDWKSIVNTVAPGIATALGGPLAGMAVGYLSNALLGKPDASSAEVAAAVASGHPDILLKMKQAEFEFQAKLAEVGVELEKISAQDRDSARNREIALRDYMPKLLATLVTVGFFSMLVIMSLKDIPIANRDLMNVMLGALGAAWTGVVSYYFGSSAGSMEKTRIIGKAMGA